MIKKEKTTPTRPSESYWLPLATPKTSPKAVRIKRKPDYFNPGKKTSPSKYI